MSYITLKNVTYTYPLTRAPSIKGLNLSLEKGKFYALIGANGSGKTTLCNILRGFIPGFFQGELQGEVIVDGKNLQEYADGELALKMGYVFQNPFNQITGARDNVYEEIAYGLENFGIAIPEMRARVERVMELANITALADKNPFALSGGQQQRVALASVIVLEPDILLIDEPTSQLDPQETERVFEIIHKMKDMGKTVVLVEHKMELVAKYADEVIVLSDGELLRFGEKHEILSESALIDYGIALPQAVILSHLLEQKGIALEKRDVITKEELIEQLRKLGGDKNVHDSI